VAFAVLPYTASRAMHEFARARDELAPRPRQVAPAPSPDRGLPVPPVRPVVLDRGNDPDDLAL
jgi:hypothetical protein